MKALGHSVTICSRTLCAAVCSQSSRWDVLPTALAEPCETALSSVSLGLRLDRVTTGRDGVSVTKDFAGFSFDPERAKHSPIRDPSSIHQAGSRRGSALPRAEVGLASHRRKASVRSA